MSNFVIDEWLWADLSGENSNDAKKEAFDFIQKVYDKCDRIVMIKGSKFTQKTWRFCRDAKDIRSHEIANFYTAKFTFNASKSVFLDKASLKSVPEQVANETNADDHYLIQALETVDVEVLVTTDRPLLETLNRYGYKCALRDQFVKNYLAHDRSL